MPLSIIKSIIDTTLTSVEYRFQGEIDKKKTEHFSEGSLIPLNSMGRANVVDFPVEQMDSFS